MDSQNQKQECEFGKTVWSKTLKVYPLGAKKADVHTWENKNTLLQLKAGWESGSLSRMKPHMGRIRHSKKIRDE